MTDDAKEATERFEVPQDMTVYYLRLLKRGPVWTTEETPELERLQAEHVAYHWKLLGEGKLLLNGPLLDDGDLRGVSVMRVSSLEEAKSLSDGDPAVRAGRLAAEFHPWMVARGHLAE